MAFDYKKEYKEFYMPAKKPSIVKIPPMNYIAVRGKGDPNAEDGEYKRSIGLLYGIAFTIKMSYKGTHKIDGYFEYVVPPLEGFWWQDGVEGIDYAHKEDFNFISLIRLPDFVTQDDFNWAVAEATRKKKTDFSKVEFLSNDEGVCVQCMHIGSYDDEPATITSMHDYAKQNGYELDITDDRYHHEIYLSDPRKCDGAKLKTVVRHPIKKLEVIHMVDSRCGLHCTGCEYKETCGCGGCIETNGHPFHGECPVAVCCQDKGIVHCGECPDIPCELLMQYSCDPEHGDTPRGARIEQCKRWYAESKGKK